MSLTKPLYVWITLYDCNMQKLASWAWDEMYPGVPPRFTYPNENQAAPYIIEFQVVQMWRDALPAGDINRVIDDAIVIGIARARKTVK